MLRRPTLLVIVILALALPATTHAQSSLVESLRTDNSLQESATIAIRSALGGRDRRAVVRRGGFRADIKIYVATYRGMRDKNVLENIQNRYLAARSELLEPRLPASIEELVSALEKLE